MSDIINIKIIIFSILLVFSSSCIALDKSNVSCDSKYENYIYDEFNPKISGERSLNSFTKGLEGVGNSAEITKIYGLALRRDPFARGELIFSIKIKGDGTVASAKSLYSAIDNCELIKNILVYFSNVKFESIIDVNDLSEFSYRIKFEGKNF